MDSRNLTSATTNLEKLDERIKLDQTIQAR